MFSYDALDKPDKKNFVDDNDVSIYKKKRTIATSLFTATTRPDHIRKLYEKAATTPVVLVCNDETDSNADLFLCSSSFGHTRRQITRNFDAEIESRVVRYIILFLCVYFFSFLYEHNFDDENMFVQLKIKKIILE